MSELKITKLTMFDGMELKEACFQQYSFPDHFHESYSIAIIEQGTELLVYGKKEVIGHANTVLVANPYQVHAHGFFDNDACRYRAVYIPVELMQFIQKKHNLYTNKTIWFPSEVIDDKHLFQSIRDFHLHHTHDTTNTLYRIVCYMISRYAVCKPEQTTPSSAITNAGYHLKQQLSAPMSVDTLAEQYGMNKFKFIRAFKKQTGLTPVSYQLLHRIDKAKQLIATSMPLVEVALETGFYDQSHFIHYFKKYTGIPPLEYRKNTTSL